MGEKNYEVQLYEMEEKRRGGRRREGGENMRRD